MYATENVKYLFFSQLRGDLQENILTWHDTEAISMCANHFQRIYLLKVALKFFKLENTCPTNTCFTFFKELMLSFSYNVF